MIHLSFKIAIKTDLKLWAPRERRIKELKRRTKLTVSSWIVVPETIASVALGAVIVIAANGVTAKLEPEGQEEMNPAAREKTERIPRGVSKAEGTAIALEATRINVECRASTVTISAATTRLDAVVIKGAAPR
jgi:hypothetical protein